MTSHVTPVVDRFWSKVNKTDGCWTWTASVNAKGYGQFGPFQNRHHDLAHRVAYQLTVGPIPQQLCVLHRCDNPPCVRPDHLFLGTRADNNRDMANKKRSALGDKNGSRKNPERVAGERNPMAHLTSGDVTSIRSRYAHEAVSGRTLAAEYGISESAVYRILNDQAWQSVEPMRQLVLPKRHAQRYAFPETRHYATGERSGKAKLTQVDVEAIRERRDQGETFSSLGKAFGVSPSNIRWIVAGRTWRKHEAAS